jgi:glutathione S-transferase
MRGLMLAIMCGAVILLAAPAPANADGPKCNRWTRSCKIASQAEGADPGGTPNGPPRTDKSHRQNPGDGAQEARKEFAAALAVYERQLARYKRCLRASPSAAACGQAPESPWLGGDSFSGPGNRPITAGRAAAIAVARLHLPTIAPGIGPSPELNRWNMAAVGYPLWLWADGPTHVGPISDSVGGLSVSLDAKVSRLTFRMGDGHSVTCPGLGQQWTTTVEPGAKSPSCGYSYTKPSLPNGSYTVAAIADWAVTWTSNGQSGVINVPAVDTTELPVGELQVLVR